MARRLILDPRQCIDYYTMYALESGKSQAAHIVAFLKQSELEFTAKQISSSLQRLRKQGLVKYDGLWQLTTDTCN
ncbi:hypothetical protein DU971_15275 [Vibrio parahaemolyticus]|uniref:hypothetical protein n=1 Tax=Vibrio parahaemolyticus TaxID=670 RepID=UPI001559DA0F|nr:hypothetical protein [Vibrio parahaemolyticus]EGR2757719.1 hypothetical protein [Vibrio parahaemolyticus]EGR9080497.1 hypothetical protein [Vibrio parahaemolyticus]